MNHPTQISNPPVPPDDGCFHCHFCGAKQPGEDGDDLMPALEAGWQAAVGVYHEIPSRRNPSIPGSRTNHWEEVGPICGDCVKRLHVYQNAGEALMVPRRYWIQPGSPR